jgi:NADPH2:quinone reductase
MPAAHARCSTGGCGQALSQIGRHKGLRMYGTASAPGSAQQLARSGVSFIDYRARISPP